MSAPAAALHNPLRSFSETKLLRKGTLLSHLIGLCLFVYLFMDRIFFVEIPFTKYIDIPLRIVALWLLLDRFGRRKRVTIGVWDYLFFGFVAIYGLALMYADAFMVRQGGFQNYLTWISDIGSPFLFFLVVREAHTRIGFSYEILLGWVLALLSAAAVLGIFQAANLLGIREMSADLYHWAHFEAQMQGPSQAWQAKGPTAHANSMAFYMVMGIAFLPAIIRYPRLRPWAFAACGLFLIATFATYSRVGMLAVFSVLVGFALFYLIRKKYRVALSLVIALSTLAVVGIAIVFAFDVERFRVVLESEGSVRNVQTERAGFRVRQDAMQKSITLGSKYPVFGLGATSAGLNNLRFITKNAYSFNTILTGLYTYVFVMYGMFGVVFIGGVLFVFLSYLWRKDVPEPFAATAFAVFIAVAVMGIAENSLFLPYVTGLIHIAAAMVLSNTVKVARPVHALRPQQAKA